MGFPRLALFALILAACSGSPRQTATVPPAPVSSAPAEVSAIVVPIRTSLSTLAPLLEAQVPKTFRKTDAYELDPQQRFGLKYNVERDPVALQMTGTDLGASTTIHYALEGCVRAKSPVGGAVAFWPCISCGFNEPMRTAIIELHSRLDWGSDWTLHSTTTPKPVQFPNPCAVTLLNIDISRWKLAPLVDDQLQALAKSIDRNTPKMVAVRPAAQKIWTSLQAPNEIAPRTWLVLEPLDAALAPIRGKDLDVWSTLTLHARTRIVVGDKPVVPARALPQLATAEPGGNGLRVPFDLQISYADASRLLTEQFGGREYREGGNVVKLESLQLLPGSEGRVNLEAMIDFHGGGMKRYHGVIYLEGTPKFEPGTSRISFPDLRYSLDGKRKNPFLRMFDRVAHQDVERRLRSAVWSLDPQISRFRNEVARGLTRQLTSGVLLRGRVDSIQPISVSATGDALAIRIVATGSAEVEVREWR